ncbi:MAG TPA: PQQ-binding-like beta-propeller repeat protein, partial [Vicinamibacterales bacterium]|nr:PQQ-binding-like beta-propeller repeat protein [Vicinamibacterales bacterium]
QAPWPGFRGPAMNGLAPYAILPTEWSATKHVAWMAEVPGQGWSSPIVVGNTVIVTSAVSGRPFKKPAPGIYGNDYIAELKAQGLSTTEINARVRARDNEIPEESGPIRYMVIAFDAATGKKKWERLAHEGLPAGGRHRKNTYASETPVSDGERVYVSFGQNVGMFAYTLDGALLWKRVWPPQPIYLDFGTGSSPIVHDGRLYLLQDSERDCFLTALDARTGADIWRTARPDKSSFRRTSSWSTPLLWKNSVRTEIVTTGHGFIWSYDLNGKELWRVGNTFMPLASPLAVGDVLYVGTGAQEGDAARPFFAIKAGATGDIALADGAVSNEFVLWTHPRASGYTPSALVHKNRVYLVHDLGTMLVLAADTGKEIYRARVGGVGHTFSASPIATGNHIYFPDEEGTTVVIEAGDTYKEIAQSDLGEMMLASPAVAGNALFLRTETKLYRIGPVI